MTMLLTEGSRRVLHSAEALARAAGSAAVDPAHLLWALWCDESRAAEILQAHGVTSESLAAAFPLPAGWPGGLPVESASEPTATVASAMDASATGGSWEDRAEAGTGSARGPQGATLPRSPRLQEVLVEARQMAANLGRNVEVGTEQLLAALPLIETEVQRFLLSHGLGAETVRERGEELIGLSSQPLDAGVRLAVAPTGQTDQSDLFRILDAAANRAREGLRVVEDFVRFSLNDQHLAGQVKELRHHLAGVEALLPTAGRLASRDTRGDVGTTVHTRTELGRRALADVVRADFKRIQEACRTLEEYGKLLSIDLSRSAGNVRYAAYTLEKAVALAQTGEERFAGRELYLLLTESLCPRGSGPVVRGALAAGVGIIQIREKTMRDRVLLAHARRVREWTAEAGCLLIMNDRPDLAVLAGADGVHVGQEELPVAQARRIVGPDRLVGVSTHNLQQAREAVLDGADYVGVGPVFPTDTKRFEQLAGLEYVAQVAGEISLPGYCIGGVRRENLRLVLAAGGKRIAVSGAICGAEDPEGVARELIDQLRGGTAAAG